MFKNLPFRITLSRKFPKKLVIFFTFLFLLWPTITSAQLNQPVETNWQGVTATLVTCQQDLDRMFVVVELKNETNEKVTANSALYFKDIYIYDFENDQKYFVLQDANGLYLAGPRSDMQDGGRWWIDLPPQEMIRIWAFFAPLPESTSNIDIFIPQLLPFEEISVITQSFPLETEHGSVFGSISVSLSSAKRRTGSVSVRLRLDNEGSKEIEGKAIYYKDAYLYDYHNHRKYPVLKDSDNHYLAEPKSDDNEGGRWWLGYLEPGKQQLMSLTFQAPPDSVDDVGIVVPFLLPFARVALSGSSGVEQEGGIEIIGVEKTIERVLVNLKAEETDTELKLMLDASVLFDYDQSNIRPDAEISLLSVLTVIEEYHSSKVRIEGHTDDTGEEDYNLDLSKKRAQSVRDWLIERGCDPERLIPIGFGESKPIASNDTEENRQQNRRVEIIIEK